MKTILNLILPSLLLTSLNASASDEFVCRVSYDVQVKSTCSVCVDHGGDGCVDWQEQPCLVSSTQNTTVRDSELHPSGDFFMAAQNSEFQFLLSQSKSGYSGRLTYIADGSELQFQNLTPLDPYHSDIKFKLKTKSTGSNEGDITHLELTCKSQ